MKKGAIVLSHEERSELCELLAELCFPARANGPVPMQRDYWPTIWESFDKWFARLEMSSEEIAEMATRAYNRATYGSDEEPPAGQE